MSLNYKIKEIKDWEKVCLTEDGALTKLTETLLTLTMLIDMGKIEEQNAAEFFIRINMWERAFGEFHLVVDKNNKVSARGILPEDVINHIGLSTNVPYKARVTFHKKIAKALNNDAADMWKNHKSQ